MRRRTRSAWSVRSKEISPPRPGTANAASASTDPPNAAAYGGSVEAEAALAVPGRDGDISFDRTDQADRVRRLIRSLLAAAEPTVVCLHRENLPVALAAACSALGAPPAAADPGASLPKGAFYVVHVSAGELAGLERYEL